MILIGIRFIDVYGRFCRHLVSEAVLKPEQLMGV